MNNTACTWSIAITIVLLVFALLSLFTRWIVSTCPYPLPRPWPLPPLPLVLVLLDASATASLSRGRDHCSSPSVSAAYAWNRNHAAAGLIWVDLGDCDIVSLLLCCRCRLASVMVVCCEVLCGMWCYGQLRNKIRTQCGLSAILRTNADKCGRIADKCEHAGMKNFLTWKGKIVYLLVTLDTTKKIQSCMIDTYVIPKYTYWNRVPSWHATRHKSFVFYFVLCAYANSMRTA